MPPKDEVDKRFRYFPFEKFVNVFPPGGAGRSDPRELPEKTYTEAAPTTGWSTREMKLAGMQPATASDGGSKELL